MKTVALFGAGQTGAVLCRMIKGKYEVLCFADNSEKKQGSRLMGLPVLSLQETLALKPDCICLCVMDDERGEAMMSQLKKLDFDGDFINPNMLTVFDIRAATMFLLAEQIEQENIEGDAAELGVFRGDFARLINAAFPERTLHLFDTFQGFAPSDVALEGQKGFSRAKVGDFSDTTVDLVRQCLLHPEKAIFHVGYFPDTFNEKFENQFSFVSLDADLYAPTAAALSLFYDCLSPGGVIMVHDVNGTQYAGAGQAVKEFCTERCLLPTPVCDLHGSVIIRKALLTKA